jgi:hypothetical protein
MAWKQISECLPAELTARMELEKAGAAKAPASCQETKGVETPASLPAYKDHTDRRMTVASQSGLPHPAAVIRLCVDNSGRTEPGGNVPVLPFAQTSLRTRRANLKLVSG